jgi:hypothetical protein
MRRLTDARGAALLNTLLILGMLGALVSAYAVNVRAHLGLRGGAGIERSGFYSAEGGLNVGVTRFANIFRASGVPEGADFGQTITVGRDTAHVTLEPVSGCTPCPPTVVPQGELFAGLYSIPYRYTVDSQALNSADEVEANVAGQFDIHTIPIFQFLAFINDHLFIMPLPDMVLHGRVHSNNDLYLQPDNHLTIADQRPQIPDVQVSAVGDIYRGGRKYEEDWRCTGTVTVDKLEDVVSPTNDLDPKVMTCAGSSPVTDATLSGWKGTIKQGVLNIITPEVGIINRGTGEYWDRADLRIAMLLDQRAPIDFGAANLCPGLLFGTSVSPNLPIIEVQDRAGVQDATKTQALWRFMCERRGAIFFNDIPNGAPTPPQGNSGFVTTAGNYDPPFASSNRIYRRAGDDTNGDGVIGNKDRNDDTCPIGILASPWWKPTSCPWPLSLPGSTSWFNDMDYRRGGFWNHREQQWMYLLNVNVRALIEWNGQNGDPLFAHDDTTDGGLVLFFTVKGPSSNAAQNNYGVRIFDSADLDTLNYTFPTGRTDPTGLTVVSDQGMIVQGNYNTRDKQPAAILSDAQWVLSQGWEVPSNSGNHPNDRKSVFDLDTDIRDVPSSDAPGGAGGQGSFTGSTALGVNAALLFGLGPSTRHPDWYNGGLENFPRFLESWNNRTFNYRGSFVSLGRAQHKLANWACGSGDDCNGSGVYDPPDRAYDYDADFNQVEKLPPMTPKIVYVQQLLYTRIFN